MEAMRKKIARLNEVIGKWWISVTQSDDKKVDESKGPQFKQERHPSIKHELGHIKGAKTNGRRIVNGYECVQFESKGKIGTDQPTQTMAVQCSRVAVPHSGSAVVKGGSAAPHKNGKATNSVPDQIKPKKKVYQEK